MALTSFQLLKSVWVVLCRDSEKDDWETVGDANMPLFAATKESAEEMLEMVRDVYSDLLLKVQEYRLVEGEING